MSPVERSSGGGGGGGFANPMTTKGDIIIENAVPAPGRLGVGSSGQVLGVSSGLPSWQSGASVLLYDYTVTGADKATIDTDVDGPMAGLFPTTFAVLEVCIYARSDEAANTSVMGIVVNNDGSNIYDVVRLQFASNVVSGAVSDARANWFTTIAASGLTAGEFATSYFTIPNYGGTVGYKRGEQRTQVVDQSGAGSNTVAIYGVSYRSTSALTRIALSVTTGVAQKLKVGTRLSVFAR